MNAIFQGNNTQEDRKEGIRGRNKSYLELKENFEYIYEKIPAYYKELKSLTEEISNLKETIDKHDVANEYIDRVNEYIDRVKGGLDTYMELKGKLEPYLDEPVKIKNIPSEITGIYSNVALSIRNYPTINYSLYRLPSKFKQNSPKKTNQAKDYTLDFHTSLAKIREPVALISRKINEIKDYEETGGKVGEFVEYKPKIMTENLGNTDTPNDSLKKESLKQDKSIKDKDMENLGFYNEGIKLIENIVSLYSSEQALLNKISDNINISNGAKVLISFLPTM
ncbi:hypothetical protein NRH57_002476 [Providencia rettgeri]|nr:hypothetical protein [Providencia rettgeri]ELR5240603.1 hypothetical protein [Providencia rettgeri]